MSDVHCDLSTVTDSLSVPIAGLKQTVELRPGQTRRASDTPLPDNIEEIALHYVPQHQCLVLPSCLRNSPEDVRITAPFRRPTPWLHCISNAQGPGPRPRPRIRSFQPRVDERETWAAGRRSPGSLGDNGGKLLQLGTHDRQVGDASENFHAAGLLKRRGFASGTLER
jgi:hypothetical protein